MHAQKEENATASGGRARTGRAHHGLGLRRPRTATLGSGGVGRRQRQQPMAAASGDGSGGGQRNGGFGMAAKGARRCISSSLSFQCQVGALLDRRIVPYVLPVFLFVVLYSKLPHKELRFIIGSIPMLNVSASLAASRIYNNRKKAGWNLLYVLMLVAFLASLGYSAVTFMASYNNYPGGHALKALHEADTSVKEKMVHIDAFTAMSGVSRFCENEYPWRYSKEEEISIEEYQKRNFSYLLNEHRYISGYKCLFAVDGFYKAKIQPRIPPLSLAKEPKVFAHGNMRDPDILSLDWPGCP